MKTFSAVIVLAALFVIPASAAAKPKDSDKRAAIAQCKSERGKSKAEHRAFKAKYHSFSRCTHRELSAAKAARRVAAQECKAERADEEFPATHDDKSFEDFYGTNHNHRNAFGKCVSTNADDEDDADAVDEDDDAVDEHDDGQSDDEHGSGQEHHHQHDDGSDDDGSDDA
jgi:hypothetical protein